jgi:AcrR family transcriptional regulator
MAGYLLYRRPLATRRRALMPAGAALDADVILAATEDVLRRYGPSKATVLDVARVLGVSHASVYRYFPSKAALRDAVTRRWLGSGRH